MKAIRLLVVLSLTLGLWTVAPRAWACSCAGPEPTDAESFDDYDVVFVGEAVEMRFGKRENFPPQIWTFDVDRVNKGEATFEQEVRTANNGGLCGYGFDEGKRYQVWADQRGEKLHTHLCGKTRLASNGTYEPSSYPPVEVLGVLPRSGLPSTVPIAAALLALAGALVLAGRRTRILNAR